MKRREFITGAAAAGTAAALAACNTETPSSAATGTAPAISRNRRQLKMVTTWPKNFPGLGMSAERIAREIALATEDRITVHVFAAGELVGAFEAFDAVAAGAADMAHHPDYYQQGKSKAFPFFTSVPFGMMADELAAWIECDGGQALWDELSERFNVKSLLACTTNTQMGGWFRREIKSVEDFKGLKMRMPGFGGEVLRRMGAAVVALPGSEIFTSLQQGAIDGAEWVGPWNDLAFGMPMVAKHYYYPGFHEPGAGLTLAINLDVWNSFSPSDQAIIKGVCGREYIYSWGEFKSRNADAQQVLEKDYKIVAKPFPDDVIKEMARLSTQLLAEVAESDPFVKRVYESYMTAMKKYNKYQEISDYAYIDARRLGLKL